jgi:hypothetical protein
MISCDAVNCQMQLSPYTTAFFAIVFDFPFAFTKDLQPGGINHQMRDFTPGENDFETDINRLCALADTVPSGSATEHSSSVKMESIKPCAARRVSRHAFHDQNGGD